MFGLDWKRYQVCLYGLRNRTELTANRVSRLQRRLPEVETRQAFRTAANVERRRAGALICMFLVQREVAQGLKL